MDNVKIFIKSLFCSIIFFTVKVIKKLLHDNLSAFYMEKKTPANSIGGCHKCQGWADTGLLLFISLPLIKFSVWQNVHCKSKWKKKLQGKHWMNQFIMHVFTTKVFFLLLLSLLNLLIKLYIKSDKLSPSSNEYRGFTIMICLLVHQHYTTTITFSPARWSRKLWLCFL